MPIRQRKEATTRERVRCRLINSMQLITLHPSAPNEWRVIEREQGGGGCLSLAALLPLTFQLAPIAEQIHPHSRVAFNNAARNVPFREECHVLNFIAKVSIITSVARCSAVYEPGCVSNWKFPLRAFSEYTQLETHFGHGEKWSWAQIRESGGVLT